MDDMINALSAAVAMEYINHAFDKKYKDIRRILFCLSGFLMYFIAVTLLNRFHSFEGIAGLVYGLVLFIYGVTALKGSKTDFLVLSIIWVIIALISAYIMFGLLGIMTGEGIGDLLAKSGAIRTYSALAAAALKFSMGRIVLAIYKRKRTLEERPEDLVMAGTFLLMFILVLGMFRLETAGLSQIQRYYLSLGLLGGMFGMILIMSLVYRTLDRYRRERLVQEYKTEEQRLKEEQIKDLYRIGREANRMRHDMKVKLDTIYGLLQKHEYEEIKKCIIELGAEWDSYTELPGDTGNEGLNAALMKAIQRCRDENIAFHYVVIGRPTEINSMDMGTLVDNLLRNGVEACREQYGNGQIEIVMRKENGSIEIEMENTIKESVLSVNPEMKTSKKEKSRHGFGMESIRKIIELYHGEYVCREETSDHRLWFVQKICLKI